MARSLIALGSNLGQRHEQLGEALDELSQRSGIELVARSSWHETAPIGGPPAQGAFLNGAVLVETSLAPQALLAELRCIERALGRERHERWAARSLDLDILFYDEVIFHAPELDIPHPRMAYRRFVLEPAAEIAPGMRHPEAAWTLFALLRQLDERDDWVAIAGDDPPRVSDLINQLSSKFQLTLDGEANSNVPPITRWSHSLAAQRPKLLLALPGSSGTDSSQRRKMLELPATGPVAWLPPTCDMFAEAVAAMQSVWPELASPSP